MNSNCPSDDDKAAAENRCAIKGMGEVGRLSDRRVRARARTGAFDRLVTVFVLRKKGISAVRRRS